MNNFTVTLSLCVQIGVDTWKQKYYSQTFENSSSMQDVLNWARKIGGDNIGVNEIIFSSRSE